MNTVPSCVAAKKTAQDLAKKIIPEPIPYDKKIDDEAIERLVTARIALLLSKPFFGNLATRLTLRNADEWCPTLATDGRYFYYNSRFVMSLRQKEVEFGVGHEVLHVVYDHMGRRNGRHPEIWNIANDYLVNIDLVEERIGELITTIEILYDKQYAGMASEEVYEQLLQQAKDQAKDEGEGDDQPGQGGGAGPGQGSNNMPTDRQIQDALGDLIDKVLDDHLSPDDSKDGEDGKDGDDKGTSGPVPMTAEERKQLKDEIREAVIQTAQQVGAGNTPGGVKRMIKDLTEAKIDWRELIAQQIQSTIKADFSWSRPSRRSHDLDCILPGMTPGQTIDVCVAIDTSGSISETMLNEFLSEIQGIMEQYDDYNVHVWCFDTQVHNPEKFTSDNMREITEYQPGGGGGTEFMCNWEWMKAQGIEPEKFIMFTDGYPYGSWGDEDYCETVFIINGNDGVEAPFGISAQWKDL